MSDTGAATARRSGFFGLSVEGLVSLGAVLAVLVAVSLPRLHGLARRENQVDARATVELFARSLGGLAPEEHALPFEELARRARLTRTLRDAEWLEGGRVLRLHGYLFELCPAAVAPAPLASKLELAEQPARHVAGLSLRAWPWSPGTGRAVFVANADGGLLTHPNEAGSWQGMEHRPALDGDALGGWQRLR
jgi:hypothetical protein